MRNQGNLGGKFKQYRYFRVFSHDVHMERKLLTIAVVLGTPTDIIVQLRCAEAIGRRVPGRILRRGEKIIFTFGRRFFCLRFLEDPVKAILTCQPDTAAIVTEETATTNPHLPVGFGLHHTEESRMK